MDLKYYEILLSADSKFATLVTVLSNVLDSELTDAEKLERIEMIKDIAIKSQIKTSDFVQ